MIQIGAIMNSDYYGFLTKLFPFCGLKEKQLDAIFDGVGITFESFARDRIIYAPDHYRRRVGFVVNGECTVERERSEGDRIVLNTLTKYGSFGIMTVLSGNDEYPTLIRTVRATEIMFIDGDDMLSIIKKYPTVAMNVIRFLAGRVSFLNEKLNTFSEKSTLTKLANHLLKQYKATGEHVRVAKSKLATEIGVGRASLYRDLDRLTEEGFITVLSKEIIINDPKGLERIIK